MNKIELLNLITEFAKEYNSEAQKSIERNHHMNEIEIGELIQQRIIDAVLVDFINYIATKYGIDYALYTKELDY